MSERQDDSMRIPVPDLIASRNPGTYLVGGCVRDLIQGATPRDFDIAVTGAPRAFAEETAARLGGRVFTLGKGRFTVFCVTTPEVQIDIISCKGSNIQEDLLERDFTINALACRLSDGRLIDVTGGLNDLRRGAVRMVTPQAFQDDPVRLVRAFRMAAAMHFQIESETIAAIRAHADLLRRSAAERIWAELQRILACPASHPHLVIMYDTHTLSTIFPELAEGYQDHRESISEREPPPQSLETVRSLEAIMNHPEAFLPPTAARFIQSIEQESRIMLKMAAMLKNIGKPGCRAIDANRRPRYHGHAARGAKLAQAIGRRLRMSNRQREWIAALVRRHPHPLFLYRTAKGRQGPPPRAIGRFFRRTGKQAPYLLMLAIAGCLADRESSTPPRPSARAEFFIDMLTRHVKTNDQGRPSPILRGQDLIQNFNLPPSPVLGTLLRRVEELHLAGSLSDRQQALRWVAEQLKKTPPA
jgi:poly(A) polymerase